MAESPLKLPPLQQAVLDANTVATLFDDLSTCTRILSVVPKRALRSMKEEAPIDLAAARAGLLDGSLRAVQVRYQYNGQEWCDTLMPHLAGAVRIVRICSNEILASTAS